MTRRTGTVPAPPIDAPALVGVTADELDDGNVEIEAVEALDSLASECGGSAHQFTVHIYKRRADRNRISRVRRVPLDEFDLDRLPVMFGGGEFTLRVHDADNRLVKKLRVDFDPKLFPEPGAAPAPVTLGAAAPVSVAPASDALASRLAALESELRAERTARMQFLETMATAALRGQGGGLQEQLGTVKAILELTGGGSGGKTPAREIAESMRAAFDMAREFSGGGGGGEGEGGVMGKVIDRVVPLLLAGLERAPRQLPGVAAARPAPAPVAAPATPPGVSAVAPPPAGFPELPQRPAPALPPEWAEYAFVGKYVEQAKALVHRNVSPGLVAEILDQAIPEKHAEALSRFAHLPDDERARLLTTLDATLEPYLLYMHAVAGELRQLADEEAEDDGNAGRAG